MKKNSWPPIAPQCQTESYRTWVKERAEACRQQQRFDALLEAAKKLYEHYDEPANVNIR